MDDSLAGTAAESLAAIVLGAGAGSRLQPLTGIRPKPLCPVANRPLIDWAIERARTVTDAVAVNVHHGRAAMESHLAGRVHLSVEETLLGTAGGVGRLREWAARRPVLVINADAWYDADLVAWVAKWDGERVDLLSNTDESGTLTPRTRVAASLMPWPEVARLAPEPAGLYEACWVPASAAGRLTLTPFDGDLVDCGTPRGYLAANLAVSNGDPVVGPGALVDGVVEQSVVWAGAPVFASEHLVRAIRPADGITVLVR